jgi:hypothetical protein
MANQIPLISQRAPWNKSKLVGQKAPLKLKEIWAIRIRLELSHRIRDLSWQSRLRFSLVCYN